MNQCGHPAPAPPDTVLRFVTSERLLHWAIAIPFLGCLTSALVLVGVYNPDPTRPYRYLFAWIHRACGTGLMLCPSLVLLANVRRWRVHVYNIRQAWIWRIDDIKWLALMGPATVSPRISLPDQGKFNAAEKLNFMMVMVFSPLLIVTGVLMWFPEISRLGSFVPWLVHCGLVAMAIPLVLGHMFMATINPGTRVGLSGMVSGFVSREWAAHHYARWFREQFPHLVSVHADESASDAEAEVPARECPATPPPSTIVDQIVAESNPWSPAWGERVGLADAATGLMATPSLAADDRPDVTDRGSVEVNRAPDPRPGRNQLDVGFSQASPSILPLPSIARAGVCSMIVAQRRRILARCGALPLGAMGEHCRVRQGDAVHIA